MKAVACRRYGPPDVIKLKEVAKPVPGDDEVLLKIRATTVTSTDCNNRNLTFVPRLMRLPVRLFMVGLLRPKVSIFGVDLVGEIEAVGKDVTRFQVSDQVFGTPGAEVAGICSTTNLDLVRSLGADRVIDYTQEDLTKTDETYDVIFDTVGTLSFSRCEHLLREDGTYLVIVPTLDAIRNSDRVKLDGADPKVENLVFLRELAEAGVLKPVIDRVYPLEQTLEAFRYVEKGHKKGNVVISVGHNSE